MKKNISADGDEQIKELMLLGIPALQQTHRELFGKDSTVLHVLYLRRKLAYELQARAHGSLSEESRQHALGIAWQTTLRTRAHSDPSRPVNATISLGHDTRVASLGSRLSVSRLRVCFRLTTAGKLLGFRC